MLEELDKIIKRLRSEDGCPWDREQTLEDFKLYLVEEVFEVFDAITEGDDDKLKEELGDLLMQIVAVCQINNKFSLEQVINCAKEKLITRHPHVFRKGVCFETPEEVLRHWEELKKQEGKERKIPNLLPSLIALQLVLDKKERLKGGFSEKEIIQRIKEMVMSFDNDKEVKKLIDVIVLIVNFLRKKKIDPEGELRKEVIRIFNECI